MGIRVAPGSKHRYVRVQQSRCMERSLFALEMYVQCNRYMFMMFHTLVLLSIPRQAHKLPCMLFSRTMKPIIMLCVFLTPYRFPSRSRPAVITDSRDWQSLAASRCVAIEHAGCLDRSWIATAIPLHSCDGIDEEHPAYLRQHQHTLYGQKTRSPGHTKHPDLSPKSTR
jgi:hypothetical protein